MCRHGRVRRRSHACDMKGNHCSVLLTCLLTLLPWRGDCQTECGKGEYSTEEGQCVPCAECRPGEEPDRICGFGAGSGVTCRTCAPGTFSSSFATSPCIAHTQCEKRRRVQLSPGSQTTDAQCGDCLSGFFSPVAKSSSASTCFPCWLSPKDTAPCEGVKTLRPRSPRTIDAATKQDKMALNGTKEGVYGDSRTEYAVLAIVPVFCMMGLLGIFFCNLLKKKGYHCTSQKELDEEASPPEKNGNNPLCGLEENGNEDTIGVLVRLITEKKENAVALEELLKDYQSKQVSPPSIKAPHSRLHLLPEMPHICRHQHHLHTVQGPATRSGPSCTRCSQKKWTEVLLPPKPATVPTAGNGKVSRPLAKAGRPGEITILSVGRFRVARIPEQKQSPPEVKTVSEYSGGDSQRVPPDDRSEQRGLLCNTVRTTHQDVGNTSKLEDVI
ncbi:tumor necrosis factor receptor superfamily member 19L isoform X4 [Ascaphus truei]|uniref:tumor necrosis factor receptor superfamily member 19L isoform X4 n=2 Tax=Ascaphus truei TaxID=8439 RepID=UPI003F5935F3